MNTAEYKTGRQADPDLLEQLSIAYQRVLGKWNYTFTPQS
jgi:hypothetical protein